MADRSAINEIVYCLVQSDCDRCSTGPARGVSRGMHTITAEGLVCPFASRALDLASASPLAPSVASILSLSCTASWVPLASCSTVTLQLPVQCDRCRSIARFSSILVDSENEQPYRTYLFRIKLASPWLCPRQALRDWSSTANRWTF